VNLTFSFSFFLLYYYFLIAIIISISHASVGAAISLALTWSLFHESSWQEWYSPSSLIWQLGAVKACAQRHSAGNSVADYQGVFTGRKGARLATEAGVAAVGKRTN
jgi:hypothetical protein